MAGFLGNGPSGAGRASRFQYAATAGQTTFSGIDQNGLTMNYKAGYVEIIVNGIWLPPSDYTATDGSSIVLPQATAAGDVIYVYALAVFNAADTFSKVQNGADVATGFGANAGLVSFKDSQAPSASQQNQAQKNMGLPAIMRSYLAGLTMLAAGGNTTLSIAAGVAADSTSVDMMTLGSTLTKGVGVWGLGGGGGLTDTGTIATGAWAHVYLIKRPDTQVVDVCISSSASAPTFGANIPAAYTLYRRIGSIKLDGSGNIVAFSQNGDEFIWATTTNDINATGITTTPALRSISNLPPAIKVIGMFNVSAGGSPTPSVGLLLYSPDTTNPFVTNNNLQILVSAANGYCSAFVMVRTNTSQQIGAVAATATVIAYVSTVGWIDRRGRDN